MIKLFLNYALKNKLFMSKHIYIYIYTPNCAYIAYFLIGSKIYLFCILNKSFFL